MLDTNSRANADARQVVVSQLERGRPVLLRETHWDDPAAAVWAATFPAAAVVSSQAPAPPGRAPGPQDDRRPAGVALIAPP
eukprot:5809647-Alexandrium_andersonii.AAC.1